MRIAPSRTLRLRPVPVAAPSTAGDRPARDTGARPGHPRLAAPGRDTAPAGVVGPLLLAQVIGQVSAPAAFPLDPDRAARAYRLRLFAAAPAARLRAVA